MVVIDRREISFENRAVLEAVACNAKLTRQLGLPSGMPTALELDSGLNRVDITYKEHPEHTFPICAENLAAFLIAYCTRIGVPLPRSADKSIDVCEAHVRLTIVTHVNPLLTAVVWPRRNGLDRPSAEWIEAARALTPKSSDRSPT